MYEKKVMLGDEKTYTKLNSDPTPKYPFSYRIKSEGKITAKQYQHLNPSSGAPMYCMPKIHSTETNSSTDPSGFTSPELLAPMVGKTRYHVKNAKHLADELKDLKLDDEDMFVSHDVVSLFTNTPIPQSIEIIKNRLQKDKSLKKRTLLAPDDIVELLNFVLTTTYFVFRGQVYQQKFGTAMGSPVSPIVANLFMEDLEQRAMESAPDDLRPKFWKRYVDDTLEVIRRGKVEEWSEHLNRMDSTGSIKFTHEEETDNSIPFLDTHIHRRHDGSIKVKVYRKKTHTNQYLAFDSHHPLHQKMGVIRTLMNRCEEIVTEEEDKEEERGTIMKALEDCGYPRWTVKNVKDDMKKKVQKKGTNKQENDVKSKGMVVLPYVSGLSEKLARIFKKRGIVTAMKPQSTLKSFLVHPKDKTDPKEGVYTIDCKGCDKKYVGETKRKLKVRVKEHQTETEKVSKAVVYTRDRKRQSQSEMWGSALTDHSVKENHVINWESARIVEKERDDLARGIKEAIYIRKLPNLNRDEGRYHLSHLYDNLLGAPTST